MSAPTRPRSAGMFSARPSAAPAPLVEGQRGAEAFTARVLTLYPEMFPGPLGGSLTGKGLKDGIWRLEALDIRTFARDKHRTVDDTPAGGGPGMVLRPDVVARALDAAARDTPRDPSRWPVLLLSPRGRPFDQARAQVLAAAEGITLLCGRFEGVDERVIAARGLEELSLGDFVMTGGEIAAMAVLDTVVRLLPGVLGNAESAVEESFQRGLLEHPHYTRPQIWEGHPIPEILLSGHHGRIAEWRLAEAERLTRERRPDLWRAYCASRAGTDGDRELSDAPPTAGQGGRDED